MAVTHELKAQLMFLRQGLSMPLNTDISLAGGSGGAPQAGKEDAKGSGAPVSPPCP